MRSLLGICLIALGLIGCAASQAPLGIPAGSTAGPLGRRSETYAVLYSFKGNRTRDGGHPLTALVQGNGTFYGTTSGVRHGLSLYGTIFALTGSGTETVLFNFGGHGKKGAKPTDLIDVHGTLFGTTAAGGSNEFGVVFAMTPSGKETILHSFAGGTGDGAYPQGLVNVNGTLYGTTSSGGTHDKGTVFAITPSGTETVLHSFALRDGVNPVGPLIDVAGTLYGLTGGGGEHNKGTVYAITPSGSETVLYSFKGGAKDGVGPVASLVDDHGTLYGATWSGGGSQHCGGGCGTVFAITPSGKERVVYAFQAGTTDGAYPGAALVNFHDALYGTTEFGGAGGVGTVFAITKSGQESVLHSFADNGDGVYPMAALLNASGTLYGTTYYGGRFGAGMVFALTP